MPINLNALGAETPWTKVTVTQHQIDALCSCLEDYNPLFSTRKSRRKAAMAGSSLRPR